MSDEDRNFRFFFFLREFNIIISQIIITLFIVNRKCIQHQRKSKLNI